MRVKQIENITLEWIVQNSFRDDLYVVRFTKNGGRRARQPKYPLGVSFKTLGNLSLLELKKCVDDGICVVEITEN